ncbi:MAG: ATP:cob(I)alamin adenosyltransferase [Bacteroidetes bacterium 4572_77]|nr:MAG: ATP:cob(I)alamin adenosyltransferase [Bacteroidetes bacterium 4572_77]
MKIYTKTGDKGETSLIGGTRVPKYNEQVEAYGSIDELNSHLGLIRDLSQDQQELLLEIQERLFVTASMVASDSAKTLAKMPALKEEDILLLEQKIDLMNQDLPVLEHFILPGGHVLASHTHIARTICRRAERLCIKIHSPEKDFSMPIKYLNRLSDFLFVLARKFAQDLGNGDVIWESRKE